MYVKIKCQEKGKRTHSFRYGDSTSKQGDLVMQYGHKEGQPSSGIP